ncbi:MAG TPA: protein kinase [Bryobacteraceae bacterium]|jgi:tetratricopeptide (TPR) repeat protein
MAIPAPSRTNFAEHLFTQAICLPQSRRESFVKGEAGLDESLMTQVMSMLHHFDRMSGFLEAPLRLLPPPPLFEPGAEIAGRFRIERFIAKGGMGEVYAAQDLLLKESVALKTIGSFDRSEHWVLEQFRDEIKLGRRISHRNICRIYDIYEHPLETGQSLLCFAMELLEGETLAARIARDGRMPVSVAGPIIRQLLSGLGEAHASGIIHRDLKPANVILTPTRAVITDFGLAQARIDPASAAAAPAGILAGSLPYMAPEQFVNAHVGPAADLFSIGVLMYEMVAGELPFPPAPIDKALEARLSGAYRPPEQWRRPIMHCLAAAPENRPKDVQEILRQIGDTGIRRRAWLLGGLGAAAAAVYGGYRSQLRMDVAPGMPVLLLDALDETSGGAFPVVDQLLRTQLNQSAHFEVLSKERIALALQRMGKPKIRLSEDRQTAREVALREGSPLVISSSIQRLPGLQLQIQIEKLGSHPYFALGSWKRSFPAESEPDLRTAASEAALWIRQSIGEHADELARRDRRPEEATTSSWESLMEYVDAEDARARGDDAEAVRRLRQALAIDDNFPLAHMRLAEFLLGLGRGDEGYLHWMRAAKLVEQRHLTDRESFRIRALFLHDTGDYAKAGKVAENWAADFPNDYLPHFYLANCQRRLGHPDEALNSLDTAYSRAPGNPHIVLNRAQLHMEQGRLPAAKTDLDAVREANDWWWQYMAEYYFAIGDYKAVWDCFEQLAKLAPEWRSRSFSLKACLLFECGQDLKAISLLHDGIAYDSDLTRLAPSLPGKLLLLAAGELRTGDRKSAARSAREAGKAGGQVLNLLQAAALLHQAGDRIGANEMAARTAHAPPFPVYRALRLRFEALTVITTNPAHAVALLRDAQRLSPVVSIGAPLALALERQGSENAAREVWLELVRYPARYWLEPDRQEPAIFRDALIHTSKADDSASARLETLTKAGKLLA